jgi:hypothetical protein
MGDIGQNTQYIQDSLMKYNVKLGHVSVGVCVGN